MKRGSLASYVFAVVSGFFLCEAVLTYNAHMVVCR